MMPWIAPVAVRAAGGGRRRREPADERQRRYRARRHGRRRGGAHRLASRLDQDALRRGGGGARSWALYGAAAGLPIGEAAPNAVTWSSVGAAILIGVGGSAWLSAEVDKSILRKTAAQSNSDPALAATITAGTPIQALNAAVTAKKASDATAAP